MKNNKKQSLFNKGLTLRRTIAERPRLYGFTPLEVFRANGETSAADADPKVYSPDLTGTASIVSAGTQGAAAILSAISLITNKHTTEEKIVRNDTNIHQSLDINQLKWIGVSAVAAVVVIVAMVLFLRRK